MSDSQVIPTEIKKQNQEPLRDVNQNQAHNPFEESMETQDVEQPICPYADHIPRDINYVQAQKQIQRSAEASKHMVFGVFGNVIKILEEFERRENEIIGQQLSMPQSNFPISNQRDKDFEDIESIVTTQLLLFETQTKACPPEVLSEVKDELKRLTISWAAVREEMGLQGLHKTDLYMAKLYEILAKGRTEHVIPNSSNVTEQDMKENFPILLQGLHDKNTVDKEYREDETRKATVPETRSSEMINEGALRIAKASGGNPDIDAHLKNDVARIQAENQDIK